MDTVIKADPVDLTPFVRGLLDKYGKAGPPSWRVLRNPEQVSRDGLNLVSGDTLLKGGSDESAVPLSPWRSERRFQELKRIVDTTTVESLSMCRFSCMTDGDSLNLAAVFYREFDLAEWLTGSIIEAVTASIGENRWANIVLRMRSGIVCGVEAAVTLPKGACMIDRHELIGRRGVACDRLVDSQVPQQSVYVYTADGTAEFTDTDAELFGLSNDSITLARAAYEALTQPERIEGLRKQHARLTRLVELAFESDRQSRRLGVSPEGGAL